MTKEEKNNILINHFNKIVKEFPWLTIIYEYSIHMHAYLVSYCVDPENIDNNKFYYQAMKMEEDIESKFDDVLFCENERLYKLGPSATIINGNLSKKKQNSQRVYCKKSNYSWKPLSNTFSRYNYLTAA